MTRGWITNASTTLEAMINPVAAACQRGYLPTDVYLLEHPGTDEQADRATDLIATIVAAYDADPPTIHRTELSDETAFEDVLAHFVDSIDAVRETDGAVAVDITPGRKYMSALAFAAGLRYDADHVYYLYLASPAQHGKCYPDMPRSATRLFDFTEVL